MEKAIFCWSGGKDSSLSLYEVLKAGEFDLKYLLTTINGNMKRISMHGVQEKLLVKQADSIGIELKKYTFTREAIRSTKRIWKSFFSK